MSGDLKSAIAKSRRKGGLSEDFSLRTLMDSIAREIVDEKMKDVQKEIEQRVQTFFDQLEARSQKKMEEFLKKSVDTRIAANLKGESGSKGEKGDTPVIDMESLALRAARLVAPPDNKTIARLAAALITVPAVDYERAAILAATHFHMPDLEAFGKKLKQELRVEDELTDAQEEKIEIDDVKGLQKMLSSISRSIREAARGNKIHGGGGGGGMGNPQHESTVVNSGTTTVTTAARIAANGFAIWAYYNGQLIFRGRHYTVAADHKTLTLLFTPDDPTPGQLNRIDIVYIRT